jgi:hypothetical protein
MTFHDVWDSIDRLARLISLANWGIALSLLFGFAFTAIAIKAGGRKDDLVGIEDLKKAGQIADTLKLAGDANERSKKLEHDNLSLRGQVATLETNASDAEKDVAGLQKAAADAMAAQQRVETDLAKQQERAATAEKELLELQERIKPRRLTDKQSTDFVNELKTLPNSAINLGYTAGGGDECFNFLKQLMPLFREAQWKTPEDTRSVTNHLDIQVIGVGILVPGPPGTDPAKRLPQKSFIQLTPTLITLRSAFKGVGIDVQFISWYPREDNIPELVIGSKPEP